MEEEERLREAKKPRHQDLDLQTLMDASDATEIGDFKSAAMPVGLLRRIMIASQPAQWEREKELHAKLRAAGAASAVAALTDWDYFFLGALSKLGTRPA